jgi:hypothetical protein
MRGPGPHLPSGAGFGLLTPEPWGRYRYGAVAARRPAPRARERVPFQMEESHEEVEDGTGALSAAFAIGLAGIALVACGDDSDEEARADQGQQQTSSQRVPDAAAARSASRRT